MPGRKCGYSGLNACPRCEGRGTPSVCASSQWCFLLSFSSLRFSSSLTPTELPTCNSLNKVVGPSQHETNFSNEPESNSTESSNVANEKTKAKSNLA